MNPSALRKSRLILHWSRGSPVIPEPNYSVTLFAKVNCSCRVSPFFFPLGVVTAVNFDDQPPLDAAQIGEVRTNPVLPTEFKPAETLSPEMSSQPALLLGGLGAKPSATIAGCFAVRHHNRAPRKAC